MNTLARRESKAMTFYWQGKEQTLTVAAVKSLLVSGGGQATDNECIIYMNKCQALQLNPFLGDAYLIKFGSKCQMVISKGGYLKIASRHPQYDGFSAGLIVLDATSEVAYRTGAFYIQQNETVVGGWAEVRRKDWSQPARAEVLLKEYDKGRDQWNERKATMIRKVALVHALREAFPDVYHGVYSAEEFEDHPAPVVKAELEPEPTLREQMQPAQTSVDIASMVQTVPVPEPPEEKEPEEVIQQVKIDAMAEVKKAIDEGKATTEEDCAKIIKDLGGNVTAKRKEKILEWLGTATPLAELLFDANQVWPMQIILGMYEIPYSDDDRGEDAEKIRVICEHLIADKQDPPMAPPAKHPKYESPEAWLDAWHHLF